MTRVAEWVALSKIRSGDWVCDPSTGQPGLVSEVIDLGDGKRAVKFKVGPPGRLGYIGHAANVTCRLVRKKGSRKQE